MNYKIEVSFCNHKPQLRFNGAYSRTFFTNTTTNPNVMFDSLFFPLTITETQCQGLEYYFETTPVNQASAFTSLSTDSLVIINPSLQTVGEYTLSLTMEATKSFLKATKNLIIIIKTHTCLNPPTTVTASLSFYLQKNKFESNSYIQTFKLFSEIKAWWDSTMQAQTNCDIKEWFFASSTDTTGTPLTSGEEYNRLQTSTPTGDMKVNTQITTSPDVTLAFKVYVKTGDNKLLNMNPVTVTININCKEETLNLYYDAKIGVENSL